MTRESAAEKSRRYLTEGRVIVRLAGPRHVEATVRGTGVIWPVSYGRGGWGCPCPVRGACSHLLAVQAVTAPQPTTWRTP